MNYEVIIVGAGHAGLCTSYFLQLHAISHMVLERGDVGHSWTSQRWDSFRVNTANKLNTLPGDENDDPDGFGTAPCLAASMKEYVSRYQLPVRTGTTVTGIEFAPSGHFTVTFEVGGKAHTTNCRQVVVASGSQNKKKVPDLAGKIHSSIYQLHSSEYQNATALPTGAVLIVGSGQSGCQIAEDLISQGRKVYLATSMAPRCPRYYRGKDIMDWLITLGFFDTRTSQLVDPGMMNMRPPLLKGTGTGRESLSLQALERAAVVLVGNLTDVLHDTATFTDDVSTKIHFADTFYKQVKKLIDDYIMTQNLPVPKARFDEDDDLFELTASCGSRPTAMKMSGVSTVIWATGFTHNFNYLKMPVFDAMGSPLHREGIAEINGLYFLGLHWLKDKKSDILFGIKHDARRIADKIVVMAKQQLCS